MSNKPQTARYWRSIRQFEQLKASRLSVSWILCCSRQVHFFSSLATVVINDNSPTLFPTALMIWNEIRTYRLLEPLLCWVYLYIYVQIWNGICTDSIRNVRHMRDIACSFLKSRFEARAWCRLNETWVLRQCNVSVNASITWMDKVMYN